MNAASWLPIAAIGLFILAVLTWFLIERRCDIKAAKMAAQAAQAAARNVSVTQLLARETAAGQPVGLNWGDASTRSTVVDWPDRIEEYPTAVFPKIGSSCAKREPWS